MGVAYKKCRDFDRAAVSLKWSLTLRPNHPEALGTAAALLSGNEGIFMDALTRMLAIGSRDELAERLAGAYAQAMGADPDALLSQARRAAKDCDLQRGLPFVDPPLTAERFFAEIDR